MIRWGKREIENKKKRPLNTLYVALTLSAWDFLIIMSISVSNFSLSPLTAYLANLIKHFLKSDLDVVEIP